MSTAGQPGFKPPQSAQASTAQQRPVKPPAVVVPQQAERALLRRSIYGLLIAISLGAMTARVLAINSIDQIGAEKVLQQEGKTDWQRQRPFLSGNDRSRWLTARALVEHGTFAIEQYVTDPKTYPNWDSIDVVMHPDSAGVAHIYSSKPPLLTTLYALPYWAIYKISGAIRGTPYTLGTHPYEIGRAIILLVNVLPLAIYFFVIAGVLERYGQSDWGRIFVMAAATMGTFLTTFAVAINNHLPAAVCAAITISTAMRIWYDRDRRWIIFALCGFFTAFTAACELPALSLFGLVAVVTLWKAPRETLLAFTPAALVVVIAFFATNWIAHHNLIPPYAHREHKPAATESAAPAADSLPLPMGEGRGEGAGAIRPGSAQPSIEPSSAPNANQNPGAITNQIAGSEPATASATTPSPNGSQPASEFYQSTLTLDSGATVTLRGNVNNWYDYEFTRTDGNTTQSYWRNPKGIDTGEPSIGKYAANLLVGHHGIFSLTPIWLLFLPGVVMLGLRKEYRFRELAIAVGLISVVVITFYILRPQVERNYGGTTCAFRWVFWLAPMWLVAMLPMADWLARNRFGRWFACFLLAVSVLSATYPIWNPWTHPWLWNFWVYMGWPT